MTDGARETDWEELRGGRFRLVYERHFRAVARVAYGVLLDSAEAKDVAQEAFVRLHAEAPSLRENTDVRAWLYRVTLNLALSSRRTLLAWSRRTLFPSGHRSPEAALVENRATVQLSRALHQLPAKQRAVLALHLDADLEPSEIAAALSITPNAARVNLHRAIAKLREVLARENIDLPFDDVTVAAEESADV